jgi:UDP-N-acetylglucosamine:LPS N-acetylglucosamine transferase
MDVLFFSKGRGRGHAIPDAAIMREFAQVRPDLDWAFASYATGAKTFQSLGYDVHDLDLPEENPFLDTVISTYRLMEKCKPRFVVAHEEFAALVAAKLMQVPAVFITDWFLKDTTLLMQPLAYAESIIFIESLGLFDEPSYVKGKVQYMGPLMRNMTYAREDRSRAREELKLSEEAVVIACLPGGWATEVRAPIADLMLSAFDQVKGTEKKLFWVAGRDTDNLIRQTKHRNDVIIVEQLWPIEQLMVASDVVVTKGNRGTIMEAAYLGIPSVSLSHGLNPVEDYIVPRIASNHPLRVKGLTPEQLTICIENQIHKTKYDVLAKPFVISASAVTSALIARLGF